MKSCKICQARNLNEQEAACPLCGSADFYENVGAGPAVAPLPPSRSEKIPAHADITVWTEPIPANAPMPLVDPSLQRPGPRLRTVSVMAALTAVNAADEPSLHPPLSSGYLLYPDSGADLEELESAHLVPLSHGGADDPRNVFPRIKGITDNPSYAALLSTLKELATQVREVNASFGKGAPMMQATPAVVRWYLYYHPEGDARIPVWLYAQVYHGRDPHAHFSFPHYIRRKETAPQASAGEANLFEMAHQALGTDGSRGARIPSPYAALQWIHDQYYGPTDMTAPRNPELAAYMAMRSEQLGGKQPLQMGDLPASYRAQLQKGKVELLGLPSPPPMPCEPLQAGSVPPPVLDLILKHNVWWYRAKGLRSDSFAENSARWGEPPDTYEALDPTSERAAPKVALIDPVAGWKFENLRLHSLSHEESMTKRQKGLVDPKAPPETSVKADIEAMWRRHEAGVRAFYSAMPAELVERWSVFQGLLEGPLAAANRA